MPPHLDAANSLQFASFLENTVPSGKVTFDYAGVGRFRPFGMLLTASAIRRFCDKHPSHRFADRNFQSQTYAAHMGYFQCVNQDFGKLPGEATGNKNYVPITYISVDSLRKEAGNRNLMVPEHIEREFRPLAVVLSRGYVTVTKLLIFAIREMVRNIEEHSNAQGVWFAGQYWPTYDLVEIAILDEGRGIARSLRSGKYYTPEDDMEALALALRPGVSRSFTGKQRSLDVYDNSGFGLYMTSQLCGRAGSFTISSGAHALTIRGGKVRVRETSIRGTALQMQLRVSILKELNNILPEIGKSGTRLAKECRGFRSASLSSLLADLSALPQGHS